MTTASSENGSPAGPQPESWSADDAVERLYATHYRRLVRLSVLLVGSQDVAEEVVQASFVEMHHRWSRLRQPDRALAYLRQVVVNRSRSVLRHRGVEQRHLDAERDRLASAPPATTPGADEQTLQAERRRAALDALQALPRRQREVLALRYYLDLDEAQIATTLGISRGAVKSHASRGVHALRSHWEHR